jgi:hypothetical protein
MQYRLIAVLLVVTILGAQTPNAYSRIATGAPVAGQNTSEALAHTITIPAGTAIPLTLVNPIRSKSTRPGDSARAIVAFPVTVGTEQVVPAGAFVEGAVVSVTRQAPHTRQPDVRIHFTRLLFANGYSVSLDANSTQAMLAPTSEDSANTVEVASVAIPTPGSFGLVAQQQPTLPPLPRVGPSPAVIGGAVGGGFAAFLVGMLVWAHHRQSTLDYVLFDAGWQFQMVLQTPVTVNAGLAAASPK